MPVLDQERLEAMLPDLIAIRRDFHAHPETAFEEVRTAGIVAKLLREWGLEVHEGIGRTGVVGVLRGKRQGQRAIGLRADMDALHITEANEVDYASQVPGKMHACGHDGHTAMLLGAARYLSQDPDFAGTINFIFQPAEEGAGGAKAMMDDGLFERFPCESVFGLHTDPLQPVGNLATRKGVALGGTMTFRVDFKGSGGHGGASPHAGTDLTIPTAQFVLGLQLIVGRNIPAQKVGVISVGHIAGGSSSSPNVMPTHMTVSGTARYFETEVADIISERIREHAIAVAQTARCTVDINISRNTPPLVNEPSAVDAALSAARKTLGDGKISDQRAQSTGGEDFAFFSTDRPGAYCWLGAGAGPDGEIHDVHTDRFDFNDETLGYGMSYWINLALQELTTA